MGSVTYRLVHVGNSLVPVKEQTRRTDSYDARSHELGPNPRVGKKYYD